MELKGYYLDGQTAERKEATIWVEIGGLRIELVEGIRVFWPYPEIHQDRDLLDPKQIRLEKGALIPETLVVPRGPFFTALKRVHPKIPRQFHEPTSRSSSLAIGLLAGLVSIGIIVSLYLWGIPFLSSRVASRVPVSWEESLGRSVVENLASATKRCSDPQQDLFLREVMKPLTASLPDQPYQFQVIVVDEPEVNAFAAPGGIIVVFQGLLEKVESTEELAGILSHEMQHILYRHSTRMLLEQVSLGLLLSLIMGDANSAVTLGKEGAGILGVLRYSRQYEEQADAEGMRLLLAAGIDPRGMIAFFERIQKEEGKDLSVPTYFSSHPNPRSRMERLKKIGRATSPAPVRPLPRYDLLKGKGTCPKTHQNP